MFGDSSLLWKRAEPDSVYHTTTFNVLPDGRIVTLSGSPSQNIVFLQADGSEQRRIPAPIDSASLVVGSDETVYVTGSNSVQSYPADGTAGWTSPDVRGELFLGPAGLLYVQSSIRNELAAVTITAGAAPGLWQNNGGSDQAHRSHLAPGVAPRIITSPANTSVVTGYRLALTVVADGSFPLTYEWHHNGVIVSEAFGSTLAIPAAASSDAGSYTVTVRNSLGVVTSSAAVVTVTTPDFGTVLWTTSLQTLGTPSVAADATAYALFGPIVSGSADVAMSLVAIDHSGNELWRTALGTGSSGTNAQPSPVIGDDGTIFVAGRKKVWAMSAAGAVRWSKDIAAATSDNIPRLALGVGNVLYVGMDMRLTRLRAEGTQDWSVDYSNFTSSHYQDPQARVRRDGNVILTPRIMVTPEGTASLLGPQTSSTVMFIGPADETVCYSGSHLLEIIDHAGQLVSQLADGQLEAPVLLNSEGNLLIQFRYGQVPFYGSSRDDLPIPISDAQFMSDLGEGRLLVANYYQLMVVSRTGTNLLSAPVISGANYVLSQAGAAIGGSQLRAYNVGITPSRSPWPMPAADARHTWRAPADFDWNIRQARSATVSTSAPLYAGYAATLDSQIDGVGPFSFQWQRNGIDLTGATSSQLTLSNPSAADSGNYRVAVTNTAGTTYSQDFAATFADPVSVPPAFYAGVVRWSGDGSLYTRYAMLVQPDRTAEILLTGPYRALTNRARFSADGFLPLTTWNNPDYVAMKNGQPQFNYGTGNLITTTVAINSATAPNGLPVGFYRGGSVEGHRAYAAVLPDGRVWWASNASGNDEITLPADQLHGSGSVLIANVSQSYNLDGTKDGVLRMTRPSAALDSTFIPFSTEWSGRSSQETLINLSIRGFVSPAWPTMIGGFVVQGPRGLLLRGAGPTLGTLGLDPATVLAQPRLSLMSAQGSQLALATRWSGSTAEAALRTAAARVGAFPYVEGSNDAALVQNFPGNLYTFIVDSVDGGQGIAIMEVYDTTTDTKDGRLINLSTRGFAGTGDKALFGGFVIQGPGPKTLLVRAIGSGLGPYIGPDFKLATYPQLLIYDSKHNVLATNKVWRTSDAAFVSTIASQVGAFAPADDDAALVITVEPGLYSAVIDTGLGTAGLALFEIYEVP